jgi:hypothetical protein
VKSFCELLHKIYNDFGFTKVDIKLSTRPINRAGTDETWDSAEKNLSDAVKMAGFEFEVLAGEGAFYGPKLEFQLTDAIGRKWQCGTIQLDYVLPERLGANYIDSDGSKKQAFRLPYINGQLIIPILACVFIYFGRVRFQNAFSATGKDAYQELLFLVFVFILILVAIFSFLRKFSTIPIVGAMCCLYLMIEIPPVSWMWFFIWMGIGLIFYALYGSRKSKLNEKAL